MGLRPAKFHEKLVLQDWWGGPPGPRPTPRRPAGAPQDADVVVSAAGRGRPARTRGSAPPGPEGVVFRPCLSDRNSNPSLTAGPAIPPAAQIGRAHV